ncbi:MAG: hypothetical protein ACRC1S_13065, partial [Vibrio sp.]
SQVIKFHSPDTPIIALSGESGERELEMINQLMDGRLEKPTSLQALRELLNHWLDKNQSDKMSPRTDQSIFTSSLT